MREIEPKQAARPEHPKEQQAKPPFQEKPQGFPGREEEMQLRPDHGERSYRGHGRLVGKTALITGGDSGIGRAVAIAFAREGADVVLSYLTEEESDARETQHWIEEAGQRGYTVPGDIRDEGHCKKLVEGIVAEQGHLDILVNNAAYQMSYERLEDISLEELDRTFRTNLFSMFFLCQAAAPRMQPGSSIINTSSIQAFMANPSLLPYAATKAAICSALKAAAKPGRFQESGRISAASRAWLLAGESQRTAPRTTPWNWP